MYGFFSVFPKRYAKDKLSLISTNTIYRIIRRVFHMKISFICFIMVLVILTTAACSEQSVQTSSSAFSEASSSITFPTDESIHDEPSSFDEESIEEESSIPDEESIEEDSATNEHCLIVFGESFSQSDLIHVYYEGQSRNAKLPVVVILEALGAEIKQNSDLVVKFRYNGADYILDIQAVSVVEEGSNWNLIMPAPGGTMRYEILENELLLDYISIETLLYGLGSDICIKVDYDNYIVTLEYR